MPPGSAPARLRRQPGAVGAAILLIVATFAVATAARPVPLAEVLLIVLVEVIAVSLVAGRTIAALTAAASALAMNWLLVPPYGTLAMADQAKWVTLVVFLLLAVGVSSLVESIMRTELRAAAAAAREAALAEVLRPEDASAAGALEALRTTLHLDAAAVVVANSEDELLCGVQQRPSQPPVLDVAVGPSFRVLGWGEPALGAQRAYVTSLATAAVRAWESERLVQEEQRSAQLAEIDAARAALLASIGHDLRTPLAGIRVSADALALAGDALGPGERAELLESLQQSAVRLDGLLDSVLEAARAEMGARAPEPVVCDLREVVVQALADLPSDRLRVQAPDRVVPARVDRVLAERVVANVAANAVQHTPPEQVVEVSVSDAPGVPTVMVVDHGPGLSQGVDTGRNAHGMGLVIVERLAGFAGIVVTRSETPGGGLTVTLQSDGPA